MGATGLEQYAKSPEKSPESPRRGSKSVNIGLLAIAPVAAPWEPSIAEEARRRTREEMCAQLTPLTLIPLRAIV